MSSPVTRPRPTLSQRVIARTADVLAISLVLIIGLTMGTEVLRWWKADPPSVSSASRTVPAWGQDGQPVEMEFGGSQFTLSRQVLEGDRKTIQRLLRDRCRAAAESVPALSSPPDENERISLEKLADLKPLEQKPGVWKVVRLQDPFEMTIGLRKFDQWRIVAWGTALPGEDSTWTVHVFSAGTSLRPVAGLPAIPVPPGGRRLMTMRDATGGSLTGFVGPGPAEAWAGYYERWFADRSWNTAGWLASSHHRTARFRPAEGKGVADVQIVKDGNTWRGIVSVLGE